MNGVMTAVSGLLLFTLAAQTQAQDWPQWRGPNRDAKVTGFTAPATWPDHLNQKWKIDVGEADASPALVGGKLYVFSRQETDEVTECLDAATGHPLWVDKYTAQPATGPAGQHPGPRSSPTVGEGRVVTLGVRGTLSCLDADTGKVLWRKDEFPGWPKFFTSMSPLIINGTAVAHLGGSTNGAIVAYNLADGTHKWHWMGDGPGYDSPVLMKLSDLTLIILQTEKKIVALDAASGKTVWQADFTPKGMAQNTATPIVDGQTLIYTGAGRGTVAVKLEKSGDTVTATSLWKNADLAPAFCSPVLKDGLLYGLSGRGQFYCINAQTGSTAWVEAEGNHDRFGSIIDAGQVLLALTPKSQLLVLQPSDKAYTQLASIKVADTPTYASPVIAGNRIFVQDQSSLTLWTLQ